MTRVAVVGGGITGLAAAWQAARFGADVVVLEAGDRFGGKVRTSSFAGLDVDESADAFLARVPEGLDLCRELGIEGELVSPAARRAYVYSNGALRLLPEQQVLGVPTDLDELAASGIVSNDAVDIAARDLTAPGPPPEGDETIGSFFRRRLGDEILERLIDPLVGGINAGNTDHLSLAATVPQLDAAARSSVPSIVRACRHQREAADTTAPVFFAPVGGMGRIVEVLVRALADAGVDLRTGSRVDAVDEGGRAVHAGAERLDVDATIVTTPPAVAAEQVRAADARAATLLAGIPAASVVLLTLAFERDHVDHPLDGSGFLVPRPEGLLLTAASWASSKWAHLAGDGSTVIVRASAGRAGDDRALALHQATLVARVLHDLEHTMGAHGEPLEVRVNRWPSSFPQYAPGHFERVAAIDAALARTSPALVVTGAAFRGLGVPACIRQGRDAAMRVLPPLRA